MREGTRPDDLSDADLVEVAFASSRPALMGHCWALAFCPKAHNE
jgi:hypothetical protein